MICKKCGSIQSNDAKFCSVCGNPIEIDSDLRTKNKEEILKDQDDIDIEEIEDIVENIISEKEKDKSKNDIHKSKGKLSSLYNDLDLFLKMETIAFIVVFFLLFISLPTGKIFPIFFSIVQSIGLVVALLMHKGHIKCNFEYIKYIILAVSIVLTSLNISSYSWFKNNKNDKPINSNKYDTSHDVSYTPYDVSECIGRDKDALETDFLIADFHNIEQEAVEDLKIDEKEKYGKVISVSINGIDDFQGNAEFKSSSKVLIKYHSYKKIATPLSSKEITSMDTELVLKAFEEAGFLQIETSEEYDLEPNETDLNYKNLVKINGIDSFEKGDIFSPIEKVDIITRKPYEKYTAKIIIDFVPNLFFSTYNVEFTIDGHKENLKHGTGAEFEYELKQGNYTLLFFNTKSKDVKGSVELELNGNTEACYKINCKSDKINIETEYVINKSTISEEQAIVPYSSINCKYKNYKNIEEAFSNAGFTNIKTEILYDIVYGWTDEGEVDKVSIDGISNFDKGDIFSKDEEIIITYHLREENDPDKKIKKESVYD